MRLGEIDGADGNDEAVRAIATVVNSLEYVLRRLWLSPCFHRHSRSM